MLKAGSRSAGELADAFPVSKPTMSGHFAKLKAAGLIHGSHGMFYTFGVLHWNSQGIAPEWIGTLWAIAIPGEVLLFAYSGAVVHRLGAIPLLITGASAAVLRWTAMSFDPPLALLFPIQLLHGLTYGAAHLGAMHFISRAVPDHAAGTAGNVLSPAQTEESDVADRAEHLSVELPAHRLGGVLHDEYFPVPAELFHPFHVRRQPEKVAGHDAQRVGAGRFLQKAVIKIKTCRIDVAQLDFQARPDDRGRHRKAGIGRDDDPFFPRQPAQRCEYQRHRGLAR